MILANDNYKMDWTVGAVKWGTVKLPPTLQCETEQKADGNILHERYTFTNMSDKAVFTALGDISIYTPFNDDYMDAGTCITSRCHTHIWCGDDISYVMALRMGGEPPHLGLVLTDGSLGGYSVERDLSRGSNDRGDFIMHPSPCSLAPGESFVIAWTLFPHGGKGDFYEKLGKYCPRFVDVRADRYVVFKNEKICLRIKPSFDFSEKDVRIMRDGEAVCFRLEGGTVIIEEKPESLGECRYDIGVRGVNTHCAIRVLPEFQELLRARCSFIVEKQQYHSTGSGLDGAYLIYDNREKHMYYHPTNDYNGGRERVCMGILLARYLYDNPDDKVSESLKGYVAYVERELFDAETGEIFNDYNRDNAYKRPYNYPWFSLFYLELYRLYGDEACLVNAYKILKAFYEKENGAHFYAIEIPLKRIMDALTSAGMTAYQNELMRYFEEHCAFILARGTDYPAHEVNFEQSIVAPAAGLLLQMYKVTGDEKYLTGAREQLRVLELFHGLQPDYHLYELAIRHWDGYWFGKKRLYGDTYPHYWSALTAIVYKAYAELTGDEAYAKKADAAYRGVLSLFFPDGSASCAYVYPVSVNGTEAGYYDAYANDQDWGLYLFYRELR
ncbi:MAG: hypothetical protein NC337_00945 [Roseburia sp.]|nr:hypothetical protein [Roseburia sp.]